MKKLSWRDTFFLYSPLLLCVGIMIPRLLHPHFGFFDDAATLAVAKKIIAGQWGLGLDLQGRFRSFYWLYYAFLYLIFSDRALGFFIGNLVLFFAITFFIIRLAKGLGLNNQAAWLVGLVFVVSGPVIENVYTLSKPELMQCLLILLLLLSCGWYTRLKKNLHKLACFLGMTGLVFLAVNTKETAILLVPGGIISILVTWTYSRLARKPAGPALEQRLILLWSCLLGIFLHIVLSTVFTKTSLAGPTGNMNYTVAWMVGQGRLILGWLRRDFLYLLPTGLVIPLIVFRKPNHDRLVLAVEFLGWLAIWLGIYLPWKYFPEYYLLPVSLITSLLCGVFFSLVLQLLKESVFHRILAWTSLAGSALLLAATLPSQVTNGQLQIATDRANSEMLAYVSEHVPQGSSVWINIQAPNEYVDEIKIWLLQIEGRSDLQVDYFHAQTQPQSGEVWILSPYTDNQFYPSVRMGVYELPSREWNASLEGYLAGRGEQVAEFQQSFLTSNFDPLRSFCPFSRSLAFCQVPAAPLNQRIFTYGWRIIRLP